MIKVKLQGKDGLVKKLPTSWREMSRRETILFIRSLLIRNEKFEDFSDGVKVFFLNVLLGLNPDAYYKKLNEYKVALLLIHINRLFTENACYPSLQYIISGFSKLRMPAHRMENSTFIEFVYAEEFYAAILEGENTEENINKLVAVLCRPARWWSNGEDPRVPLSDEHIEKYSEVIGLKEEGWKPTRANLRATWYGIAWEERFAVYFYYYHVRKELRDMYPNVFRKKTATSEDQIDFTSHYRWRGVLHNLVESGTFGKWDDTCNINLHVVLDHLNYNQDRFKEMEMKLRLKK
jgi:hypothetical protein